MKRSLLTLGLSFGLWVAAVPADEWRAPRQSAAGSASAANPAASERVQLGRPVTLGKPVPLNAAATSSDQSIVQAAYMRPTIAAPRAAYSAVRAQSPDAPPPGGGLPPEEAYNSGVVTEGPPAGGPILAGPRRWLGSWFDGSHPLFGGAGDMGIGNRCAFQSDHAFDSFISPVTNPFFFEDPRSLTELRPIVMYQRTPGDNPLFRGGDIQFYALQGRLALTDRLSIVLHKLGYVVIDPDDGGDDADASGFAELQIGPKYTFWRDDCTNTLAAIGVNFEIPVGDEEVFQDTGNGAATPYISAAQKLGNFHLMGAFGYRFAFNNERSDSLFTSAHVDYSLFDRFYPLAELNWYHYTDDGNSRAADFEGADLFNFGSNQVKGTDVVSLGLGFRAKITEAIQLGAAYEFPLTSNEDLLDYRITADLIFRY